MDPIVMSMITSALMSNSSKSMLGMFLAIAAFVFAHYNKQIYEFLESRLPRFQKTEFSIVAKLSTKNNNTWSTTFPKTFLAVNNKIQEYIVNHGKDKRLNFEVNEYSQCSYEYKNPVLFFVLQSNKALHMSKNIRVYTDFAKVTGEKDYIYTNLIIKIESLNKDYKDIKEFVDQCLDDYDKSLMDAMKVQHVFVFDKVDTENDAVQYSEITFNTNKTFDNMFFEQKNTVKHALDNFSKNQDEYKHLGIPHTLGFMFYGLQGSGKTSCIKCIARHTNRHIVIIPMKRINDIDTLKRIFLEKNINNITIPNEKRLYVFEEIDCGSWEHVVLSRKLKQPINPPPQTSQTNNNNKIMEDLVSFLKKDDKEDLRPSKIISSSDYAPKNDINLGEFLELLDGIIEIPGRIIIMTSNHPEKLDGALIRPGRIDYMIEFKRMTIESVRDMYRLWFKADIPVEIVESMTDYMFSQAELGNLFACKNLEKIHAALRVSPCNTIDG